MTTTPMPADFKEELSDQARQFLWQIFVSTPISPWHRRQPKKKGKK